MPLEWKFNRYIFVTIFLCSFVFTATTATEVNQSSEANRVQKNINAAVKIFLNGKIRQGFERLLPFADTRNPKAMFYVGLVYSRNLFRPVIFGDTSERKQTEYAKEKNWIGLPINNERGFQLIKQAADAGSADALVWIGGMYLGGIVFPKDLNAATKYLKSAAKLGKMVSYRWLSAIYASNEYSKQNLSESYKNLYIFHNCVPGNKKAISEKWKIIEITSFGSHSGFDSIKLDSAKILTQDWMKKNQVLCENLKQDFYVK
ncbi:MAG: hypothetical protein CMM52_00095 [Rhodospirillaceae bacterium]|nr:hypothetical protein [Rhodospirillaceae bacterium]|tara:strand:- start:8580 stop:9359 length:780 start_codon:yes stop_codon:yes gene_type:complete